MESIISFADIGEFIDQPVKTYSSGMFLRLAFSVAVSGQSDILIVDEILAVGDAAFQRKCFGKVERVMENGGSAIFVSHSAQTIVEICDKAILFDRGEIIMAGSPKDVVANYQRMIYASPANRAKVRAEIIAGAGAASVEAPGEGEGKTKTDGASATFHPESERYVPDMVAAEPALQYESRGVEITSPALHTLDGRRVNIIKARGEYVFSYTAKFTQPACKVRFGTVIKTVAGLQLGGCSFDGSPGVLDKVEAGQTHLVEMRFHANLAPGVYFFNAGVAGTVNDEEVFLARTVDALMFRISESEKKTVSAYVDFLFTPSVTRIQE
jgi:lipopolysaccharide transport system ATP-binding protein